MMSSAEPTLTLVLVGPMAAGKTSIGRKVARMLEVPFTDTDKRIAADHGPIPEIFAAHGEAHFRSLEREAVRVAVDAGGVVSLGGGAVVDAETRALLQRHPVVFLTVDADAVARRIGGTSRPLLSGEEDPVTRWRTIFDQRRGWYEQVADLTVDTSRRPMRALAEEIAAWRRKQS